MVKVKLDVCLGLNIQFLCVFVWFFNLFKNRGNSSTIDPLLLVLLGRECWRTWQREMTKLYLHCQKQILRGDQYKHSYCVFQPDWLSQAENFNVELQ